MSLDSDQPQNTKVYLLLSFYFILLPFSEKNDTTFVDQPFVMSQRGT